MPIIPLFGLGQQGKSPTVTAQRHLNLYAEITQEGEKSNVVFYGTPGLTLFTSLGDTPIRGIYKVGSLIYAVHRGTFYEINNAGVATSRGTLGTFSGRVDISYNGTQIAIVDGSNLYIYTIATTAFATVTTNVFPNPSSVTFQDGFFILSFRNSGIFQISSLYNGLTWDALDYATAESNPDSLLRVIADHGEIVLLGEETTEFWGNSGAQDYPYTNQRGTTAEFGLAATWSLTKYNDTLAGLFKGANGQVQVMRITGHALTPISTQEIDYLINSYTTVSDATGYAYLLGGHPMYQINFPSAGKSWLFDMSTNLWTPLESGLDGGRHRGEMHLDYLNKPLITDYSNGNIYVLDVNAYTDNGLAIPREIVGKHYLRNFNRMFISSMQLDFETGIGTVDGQGLAPQVMLKISKDNGHTWGNEIWANIGKIGQYFTRVIFRRLGASRDWLFKIRVTDPVKVVITSASIIMDPSNEQ